LGAAQHRLAGRHAKILRIKQSNPLEHRTGLDVARIEEIHAADTGLQQLVVRKNPNGFHSGAQIAPERLDIYGSRKSTGDSNDGDRWVTGLGESATPGRRAR